MSTSLCMKWQWHPWIMSLFHQYLLHYDSWWFNFHRGERERCPGGGGGTPKNFWRGCAAPVFGRIPLAKEILLENIPLGKEHFLIMSPFLHDIKKFQPHNSLFKRNFPKTDAILAPKCHFLGGFVKNIPLAKDFRRKIYPWLRNFCQKYTLG